jgi:hypothetical protein
MYTKEIEFDGVHSTSRRGRKYVYYLHDTFRTTPTHWAVEVKVTRTDTSSADSVA